MTILVLIGMAILIIWEMFHGRISLSWVLLMLLVNYVSRFRLELMYISLTKSINLHSSPWFSASCPAAMVHRNHFFPLCQQNKSFESKVKFWQASNHCKRFLQTATLAYANKTKKSIISQKLPSWDFWQISSSFLNQCKFAIPPLFNSPELLSSASDKANLLAENFYKNSILDDSGISLPVFPSRTILKLHNISVILTNNSQDG